MKIIVTGGNGQLGTALKEILAAEEVLFTDTDNMDITNPEVIEQRFSEFKPEVLVHGAAYTNVDGAEENPEICEKVNAGGTKNLAEACASHNVSMVYISTDYVFDGTAGKPYLPDAPTNPLNVYGKTKLAGEKETTKVPKHWILRTSWVYGEGKNFVRTMLGLAENNTSLKITGDQYGRPTAAIDLAKAIYDVINKKPESGIYHITGDGPIISWADFAAKIFEISGLDVKVTGRTTEEYLAEQGDRKVAVRPKYSALDLSKSKQAGLFLSDWEDSLKDYLKKESAK